MAEVRQLLFILPKINCNWGTSATVIPFPEQFHSCRVMYPDYVYVSKIKRNNNKNIFFPSDCNITMMKDSFENKGIEEKEDEGKESVEDFISEKSLQVTDDSGGNMNEFIIYEDPNKEDGCDDQAALIVAKSMQVHSRVKTGQSSTDNSKFMADGRIHLPLNKNKT